MTHKSIHLFDHPSIHPFIHSCNKYLLHYDILGPSQVTSEAKVSRKLLREIYKLIQEKEVSFWGF